MSVTRRSERAMLAVLLMAVGLFACSPRPALAEGATGRVAWVIDGDTFQLASGERIRIAGIDAPETREDQAKCPAEIGRGRAATRAATALLRGKTVSIDRVGRSYGRTVARITLDGRDLAGELVARGIALPWPCGGPKPSWCG